MLPLNFTHRKLIVLDKQSSSSRILYRGCIYRCRELVTCSRRPSSGIGRRTTTTASGTSRRRRNGATSIGRRECSPASSWCTGCKYLVLVSAFIITPTVLIKLHCCTAVSNPIPYNIVDRVSQSATGMVRLRKQSSNWSVYSYLGAELKCRFCSRRHVIECKCVDYYWGFISL